MASQLVQRIEPDLPIPRTAFLDDIYLSAEDRAIGSWPAMTDGYKKWLGVRFTNYTDWQSIVAMNMVRNAIAHGVGELTRRQARRNLSELASLFGLIGVKIEGTRLRVSDSAIRSAADAGRRFVIWLDVQLSSCN